MAENYKIAIASLVVILSSNATGYLNVIDPTFRADAFTKLMAQEMESRIMERVTGCEFRLEFNEYKLKECRKEMGELDND